MFKKGLRKLKSNFEIFLLKRLQFHIILRVHYVERFFNLIEKKKKKEEEKKEEKIRRKIY